MDSVAVSVQKANLPAKNFNLSNKYFLLSSADKSSARAATNGPSTAASALPAGAAASDLIRVVQRTFFDDAEAQELIDVLLNKQAGGGSRTGEWQDTAKGGQGNDVKDEFEPCEN